MKANSKRFLLTAGSLLTAAMPIVAVVSCGSINDPSQDDLKLYRDLTSPTAYKMITGMWLEKVINERVGIDYKPSYVMDDPATTDIDERKITYDIKNNAEIKKAAQYLITVKVQSDPEYLKKMADTLANSGKSEYVDASAKTGDKYSKDWMRDNGILRTYPKGVIKFGASANNTDVNPNNDGLTDDGLDFIFQSQLLDFRLDVYKFIVTSNYLEKTNKAQYELAFKTRVTDGQQDINREIKTDDYLLIHEMIVNKYFAKWEVELPIEQSRTFIGRSNMIFDEAILQLDKDSVTSKPDSFAALAKYSEQEKTFLPDTVSGILQGKIANGGAAATTNYEDLIGFKGINSQSAQGTKALSFKSEEMKKMKIEKDTAGTITSTQADIDKNWEGFIVKDDLNTFNKVISASPTPAEVKDLKDNGIPYIADKQQVAKITFTKGLMPVWDGTNFVLNVIDNTSTADNEIDDYKEAMAMFIAANKPDYYNDAVEYFRTTGETADGNTKLKGTILEIKDDSEGNKYKEILIDAGYKFVEERNV